ncbi:D-alanine--D-alanine ligase family protein [Candidatus Poriferisodalis sp.]|uniref:D-alanine--D-alanine ligase family protein n=1 Tax=Candidatus Poriferisodalis sp. TaxID=3101277 RepID=UPI003B5AC70B
MTRPGVCFGGPSPEHDISILTGLQAVHALAEAGRDPVALYWSPIGTWHEVPPDLEASAFADGLPRSATEVELAGRPGGGFVRADRRRRPVPVDVVINCCHGGPGEDGGLPALFDLAGLAYTGPGQRSAAICMDKLAFSGATEAAGLRTLPLWLLTSEQPDTAAPAELADGPLIVKPRFGGSSIGIEIVADLATARALAQSSPLLRDGAVVQRYLTDIIDLNISVRTWPKLRLSAVERPLRSDTTIYTYAEKYLTGGGGMATAPRELPATLPATIESTLRAAAVEVSRLVMARSVMRIDFLWDGGDDPDGLWVNEINPIPGSLSWYFWSGEGDSLIELLDDLIAEALDGPTRHFLTQGADGTALRSVGTIAAKLA